MQSENSGLNISVLVENHDTYRHPSRTQNSYMSIYNPPTYDDRNKKQYLKHPAFRMLPVMLLCYAERRFEG